MNDVLAERDYAWRMIRAARLSRTAATHADSTDNARAEIIALLGEALDAGLDRTEIIIELADLGSRLFALCNPADLSAA